MKTLLEKLHISMEHFISSLKINRCNLDDFNPSNTLVVMIDMVNGFCKFGALSSEHVNKLVPKMSFFLDECIKRKIPILAYQDAHSSEDAKEFKSYPPHCIKNTKESEIVDELNKKELFVVPKNSTNGFLAFNPLSKYKNAKNFLVIGCVSDICIKDFSCTLSKYLDEKNIDGQVFVIENLISTFHADIVHDKDVEHLLSLYQMQKSGVKFLKFDEI